MTEEAGGKGASEQGEQALPLCRGAQRNMGIKPRPSRTLELGRSTSSIPASPLPLSPCPPAGGSDDYRLDAIILLYAARRSMLLRDCQEMRRHPWHLKNSLGLIS